MPATDVHGQLEIAFLIVVIFISDGLLWPVHVVGIGPRKNEQSIGEFSCREKKDSKNCTRLGILSWS